MNQPIDNPYQLLFQNALQNQAPCLWFADESFPASHYGQVATKHTRIATNRYDIYAGLINHNANVVFSDFKLSDESGGPIEKIYYRVSKEKAVTHHLINQAFQRLDLNGELHLSGYKNDGIKTYLDKAETLFGESTYLENGPKASKYGILKKIKIETEQLDDKDYTQIRDIGSLNGKPIQSKPGVFGWNKQDPGSQFLVDSLSEFLSDIRKPVDSVLDLGCGYGFIALHAFYQQPILQQAAFTLTDNNAAAIDCATLNLALHHINGTVIADDCGSQIDNRFRIILCNPPFHKGFDVSNDITDHFLENVKRLLHRKGRALLVVNQFVGLEKRAEKSFNSIEEIGRNKSFKLISLSNPKR